MFSILSTNIRSCSQPESKTRLKVGAHIRSWVFSGAPTHSTRRSTQGKAVRSVQSRLLVRRRRRRRRRRRHLRLVGLPVSATPQAPRVFYLRSMSSPNSWHQLPLPQVVCCTSCVLRPYSCPVILRGEVPACCCGCTGIRFGNAVASSNVVDATIVQGSVRHTWTAYRFSQFSDWVSVFHRFVPQSTVHHSCHPSTLVLQKEPAHSGKPMVSCQTQRVLWVFSADPAPSPSKIITPAQHCSPPPSR